MSDETKSLLNPTTILLSIVLTLSAWTLKKVTDIGEAQAMMKVQVTNLERIVYRSSAHD